MNTFLSSVDTNFSTAAKSRRIFVLMGLVTIWGACSLFAANFFPSTSGGNWNAGGAWNATTCGGLGGLVIPTTTADVITIGPCVKTITVTSNYLTAGAITINGGTLVINSGVTLTCTALTMSSGTLTVNGTLNVTGGVSITGGTYTVSATGTLGLIGGAQSLSSTQSFYNLNIAGSGNKTMGTSITVNNQLTLTSNNLVVGPNTLTVGSATGGNGIVVTSGRITTSTTSSLSFGGSYTNNNLSTIFSNTWPMTIANFTMTRNLCNLGLGSAHNLTVTGAFTLTAGKFSIGASLLTLNGIATGNINGQITGGSTSDLTLGGSSAQSIYMDLSSTVAGGTNTIRNLINGNTNASGLQLLSNMRIGGTLTHTNSTNRITIAPTTSVQVLTIDGNITGNGGFIGNSTYANLAINGSGALTGAINFFTTTALSQLTMNRSTNGAATMGTTLTVSTLTLNQGLLNLGTTDLNIAAGGTVNGNAPSASNMVVTTASSGYLTQTLASGASNVLFPIGENIGSPTAEYCGFTLTVAANSLANRIVGFKVIDNANPPSLPSGTADYTTRYYTGKTSSTTGTFTWSASLPYFTTDIVGVEANMVTGQAPGSTWTQLGTVNTASNLLEISSAAIANLSTGGTNFAGLGILCPNPSGPNNFTLNTISNTLTPVTLTGTVGLSATTNVSGIIIFANTVNTNASPAEGSNYNVGDVLPSGSICIFRGGTVGLNVPWTYDASLTGGTDLLPNTFYYFNIYTYAEGGACNTNYSGTWSFANMAPKVNLSAPGSFIACNNMAQTFNLPYTSLEGEASHYGLVWNSAALSAGFINFPSNAGCGGGSGYTALQGSPIAINIPAGIAPGNYTGYINGFNSTNGYDECTYSGGGISNVSSFTVTITSGTSAPTGPAVQPFCVGATVADLAATGTAIQWYATAVGGSPLAGSTSLVDGTHYFASQTSNGCEGTARLDVTAVAGLAGVVTVGSGGDYPTFNGPTGLFAAINARGLAGHLTANVISDITETTSTSLLGILYGCGGPWTLTITPDQAVMRTISGTVAGPIFDFVGADYVTVDGRPGGAGTTKYLTISNTNASNPTIEYTQDASNHFVRYCTVKAVNTSQTSGVIAIGLTSVVGGTGNDNITLANNDLSGGAGGSVANIVYMSGQSSPRDNSNIVVSNNNIFDFTNTAPFGVKVNGNNTGVTISGNSFYQTAPITTNSIAIGPLSSTSNSNVVINGNFIGGSGPYCSGTWSTTNQFIGIQIQGIATVPTTQISNNTIRNIQTTGVGSQFQGMVIQSGNVSVTDNVIGDPLTPNSILNSGTGVTWGLNLVSSGGVVCSNNVIANLTGTSIASTALVEGIHGRAPITITGNTVSDLTGSAQTIGTGMASAVLGISLSSQAQATTISGNTIHSLTHTATATQVSITGIAYSATSSGNTTVSSNFVHSFNSTTTNNLTQVTGILAGGNATGEVSNNMVRLGIKSDGAGITVSNIISGILDASTGANNFFHNSVYIGGSGTSLASSASTYAFQRTAASGADRIYNNIFFNGRLSALSGSTNYAMGFVNISPLESDNNDLYATSQYGYVGFDGANDLKTLADWNTGTGFDMNSISADPLFLAATGNSGAVDLHIAPNSPIEAMGDPNFTLANDIDGEVRANLTPVDLGADAGNFGGGCTAPTLTAQANGTPVSITVCGSGIVNLDVNAIGGSGCNGNFEYAWMSSNNLYWDGSGFNSSLPVYDAAYSSISITPSSNSTYSVEARCSTDNACVSNPSIVVVDIASPVDASFTINPSGCIEVTDLVTLTAVTNSGTHSWDFGDGSGVNNASFSIGHYFLFYTDYFVIHTITDAYGCTWTSQQTLSVQGCNQAPNAVCQNITVNADANCQGNAAAADFNNGSSDPNSDPLTFSVAPAGPFALGNTSVVLTASDGSLSSTCTASIQVNDADLHQMQFVPMQP